MEFDIKPTYKKTTEQSSDGNLSLYLEPPDDDITLLECEELVAERLHILQVIERLKDRYKFLSADFRARFAQEVGSIQPIYTQECPQAKLETYKRRDQISHFLLRLACATSPELTQRFISRELDLLRVRLGSESSTCMLRFLADHHIKPDEVSVEERGKLADELSNGNRVPADTLAMTAFYRVRWTECRELVRARRVFLHRGYCYVTVADLIQFVTQKFRALLSVSMNLPFKKQRPRLTELNEDDRLLPILVKLVNEGSTSATPSNNPSGRTVRVEEVNKMALESFPPCMRRIHSELRAEHHLKYFARQQYGLFLKGAGMPLDESIRFFRDEFTKRMDVDKFTKNYVYNIRHMYGQEGNRVDHKPSNCANIILNNQPGANDCHGCPFRHVEANKLANRLTNMQISKERVDSVVKMASEEHRYDMACTRVFEYAHAMSEGALGHIITSPNEWFELSRDVHEGRRTKEAAEKTEVLIRPRHTLSQQQNLSSL